MNDDRKPPRRQQTPHRLNLHPSQKPRFDSQRQDRSYSEHLDRLLSILLGFQNVNCTTLSYRYTPAAIAATRAKRLHNPATSAVPNAELLLEVAGAVDPEAKPKASNLWRVWVSTSVMAKLMFLKTRCINRSELFVTNSEFVELVLDLHERLIDDAGIEDLLEPFEAPDSLCLLGDNDHFESDVSSVAAHSDSSSTLSASSETTSSSMSPLVAYDGLLCPSSLLVGSNAIVSTRIPLNNTWSPWLPGNNQHVIPIDVAQEAVHLFFDNVTGYYLPSGLLYKPQVLRMWDQLPDFLRFSIVVLGLAPVAPDPVKLQIIKPYYFHARDLTYKALDSPSIELVQSLILLSRYAKQFEDLDSQFQIVDLAVRAAKYIGLDRPSSYRYQHWIMAELARRAWYQCSYFTLFNGFRHQRQLSIEDPNLLKPEIPKHDMIWYNDSIDLSLLEIIPASASTSLPNFAADVLRFLQIERKGLEFLSLFNGGPITPELYGDQYEAQLALLAEYRIWQQEQTQQLWDWYGKQPEWMRDMANSFKLTGREIGIGAIEILHWNLLFHGIIVLVNYPAMIEELWLYPDATVDTLPSLRRCLEASKSARTLMMILSALEPTSKVYVCLPNKHVAVVVMVLTLTLLFEPPREHPESYFYAWPLVCIDKHLLQFPVIHQLIKQFETYAIDFCTRPMTRLRLDDSIDPKLKVGRLLEYRTPIGYFASIALGPWVPRHPLDKIPGPMPI